jgi:hypothetical protein
MPYYSLIKNMLSICYLSIFIEKIKNNKGETPPICSSYLFRCETSGRTPLTGGRKGGTLKKKASISKL